MTDHSVEMRNKILALTGSSQITNIYVPKRLLLLRKIMALQDNGVYINPVLRFFLDIGCTFDIIASAWCHAKKHVDFKVKQHRSWGRKSMSNATKKDIECRLMGKLVPQDESKQFISAIATTNEEEFKQLKYNAGNHIVKENIVLNDDNVETYMLYFTTEAQPKAYKKGCPHIHSYILGYQFINFMIDVLKIDYAHIMKIKVDCVITSVEYNHFDKSKWHYKGSSSKDHSLLMKNPINCSLI